MADRAELERKLADLKAELDHVEGGPTEVYSRIVGYYRSVRNWNAGKRAEYSRRQTFSMPGLPAAAPGRMVNEAQAATMVGARAEPVMAGASAAAGAAADLFPSAAFAARESRP